MSYWCGRQRPQLSAMISSWFRWFVRRLELGLDQPRLDQLGRAASTGPGGRARLQRAVECLPGHDTQQLLIGEIAEANVVAMLDGRVLGCLPPCTFDDLVCAVSANAVGCSLIAHDLNQRLDSLW